MEFRQQVSHFVVVFEQNCPETFSTIWKKVFSRLEQRRLIVNAFLFEQMKHL